MEKELLLFEARCSSLQANLTVALRQIGAYPKKICSSSCTEQSCSLSAEETKRGVQQRGLYLGAMCKPLQSERWLWAGPRVQTVCTPYADTGILSATYLATDNWDHFTLGQKLFTDFLLVIYVPNLFSWVWAGEKKKKKWWFWPFGIPNYNLKLFTKKWEVKILRVTFFKN